MEVEGLGIMRTNYNGKNSNEDKLNGLLAERLMNVIRQHEGLMRDLITVRALNLPECYIAAGYIRNYVWDLLHGYTRTDRHTDIDVVYYDLEDVTEARDRRLDSELRSSTGNDKWSVKNQARMHTHNGNGPYHSTWDALSYWPEVTTAIGARLTLDDQIELCCPHGLEDLFALRVRRSPKFHDRDYYLERIRKKNWQNQWPQLTIYED